MKKVFPVDSDLDEQYAHSDAKILPLFRKIQSIDSNTLYCTILFKSCVGIIIYTGVPLIPYSFIQFKTWKKVDKLE